MMQQVGFGLQHLKRDCGHFSIEKLIDNSKTDFDLYISLNDHLILYSGHGYRWDWQELNNLVRAGYKYLYVRNEDSAKVKMYESLACLPKVDVEQAPHDRIRSIHDIGAKFTQCIYEGELTPYCVEKAVELSSSLVACIMEGPGCIRFIRDLANHDYYTYFHSVRVAAYATAICLRMGETKEKRLQDIALGALFHDIGKSRIPTKIINKQGPLTEIEWQEMRTHPEMGHGALRNYLSSHVALEIIVHHHEKRNGHGYPHALDQRGLLPEVQVATLADIFDALTSSRSYQARRTRFEALDFIKNRLLVEEVCPEAFKALVMCLAS